MNVKLPMCLLDWISEKKKNINDLSSNRSEGAMQLLEKNQDKIDWSNLSKNPSAIQLLEKNLTQVQRLEG